MAAGVAVWESVVLQQDAHHRSVLFSVKHRLKGCRHIDLLVKFRMPSRQPSLYLKSFPFQLVHQKQRGIELFPAYLLNSQIRLAIL